MTEDEFWNIIELTRSEAQRDQLSKLTALLQQREAEQIVAFQAIYDMVHENAYRHNLVAAADLINDGISDDGFDYFRDWLISQGRAVYDAALANPDSLADVITSEYVEFELFRSVAHDVYQAKVGGNIYDAQADASVQPIEHDEDDPEFDESDVETKFPRLFEKVHQIRAERPPDTSGWFEKVMFWK